MEERGEGVPGSCVTEENDEVGDREGVRSTRGGRARVSVGSMEEEVEAFEKEEEQ